MLWQSCDTHYSVPKPGLCQRTDTIQCEYTQILWICFFTTLFVIDLLSSIVSSQVQASNGFAVLFSVAYTSKVEEVTASEVPVVGLSRKQLNCYADKPGFPAEIKAVRWYKDDGRIRENKKYKIVGM